MAQVAARSAQQPNGASSHYHNHKQRQRHDSASSSPRSANKLHRSASFTAPSPSPHKAHSKYAASASFSSPTPGQGRGAATEDGGNSSDLQTTMKQRGMLHALLAEPVRFVKSNEKQGQDYSAMGIVPVNDSKAAAAAAAKKQRGSIDGAQPNGTASSLLLHTSDSKLNGIATSSRGSDAEAGPSSLAAPLSPTKAKKASASRDFYPYKISLRFPGKVRPAATGLSNYGNTCYMNSVMQALIHTPPLAYALLTQELEALHGEWGGKPNVNFDAVVALQNFAKRSLQGGRNVNAPQEFNRNLKAFAKPLRQGRQEDAHEYMRFLLEAIQQSCLSRAPKGFKPDDPARQTTFVQKIFGGRLRSRVTCHNCKHNSDTFDPIMDLSLDMRKGINSLNDAFRAFVAKDKLTGSEKYRCDSCKRRVDATKQFTIDKAPPALTIHLKRFTIFGGKISRQIAFDEAINIAPYMSDRSGSARYRLYAVVHHYGSGPNSGHYVASVKSPSGKWTHMDDSHVSEMNRQGPVGDSSAYILFYLREKDEALEQAIATNGTVAGKAKAKSDAASASGFSSHEGTPNKKKRKQAASLREGDDGTTASDDEESDGGDTASSMAAKLQKLSKEPRKELLRRAQSAAASSPLQSSSSNGISLSKVREAEQLLKAAAKKKQRRSEAGGDSSESEGIATKASSTSQALDGLLSSKPTSAASFYGSSGARGGALEFDGEGEDELGMAVARDEYESLVGGNSSAAKPNGRKKSVAPPSDNSEDDNDEDDDEGMPPRSLPKHVAPPLSKKQKRLQKKAAQLVDEAKRQRSVPSSPYALAQMGGGGGAGSGKKHGGVAGKKNNNNNKSKSKAAASSMLAGGGGGKFVSRMKPRMM